MAKKRKNSRFGEKVDEILDEGVRKNTKKPVSALNPRRKVPMKQALAIAFSLKRRGKA